jgi:hypothetical protein
VELGTEFIGELIAFMKKFPVFAGKLVVGEVEVVVVNWSVGSKQV